MRIFADRKKRSQLTMPHTQAFIGIFVERTAKRHPGLPREGLTECAINESCLAPEEIKSFFCQINNFLIL